MNSSLNLNLKSTESVKQNKKDKSFSKQYVMGFRIRIIYIL